MSRSGAVRTVVEEHGETYVEPELNGPEPWVLLLMERRKSFGFPNAMAGAICTHTIPREEG